MDIDVDHEMYLKFEEYRYNAQAEGARPMDYHAWKSTPIAQGYLQKFEAQAPTAPPPAQPAAEAGAGDRDIMEGFPRASDGEMRVAMMDKLPYHMVKTFDAMVFERDTLQAQLAEAQRLLDEIESPSPKEPTNTLNAKMDFAYRRYFYVAGEKIRAYKAAQRPVAPAQADAGSEAT